MKPSWEAIGFRLIVGTLAVATLVWGQGPTVVVAQETPETVTKQLQLVVGQQRIIKTTYAIGDVISNSRAVAMTPFRERREILLQAVRPGTGSLLIYDVRRRLRASYDIQVLSQDLERTLNNVKALLSDVEGLTFRIVGNQVVIEGEVYLQEELQRVNAIAAKNENVISMVTLSEVTQRIIANTIEKEIGRPDITVRPLRNQILLEGVVYSETAKVRAEAIAKAYFQNIVNVLEVRQSDRPPSRDKTIVLIAHYLNLSKSLLNSWGIQWTPLFLGAGQSSQADASLVDAQLSASYDVTNGTLTIDPIQLTSAAAIILPNIQWARSSGYVRVIENPTVSVKSGEPVKMFAGMQYPYPVYSSMGMTIEWKDIGVTLEATPYAQGDSVDMQLKIEVTDLGQISNSNGDPAIDTNRIETRQFCKAGESIVIGGLARLSDSVVYNRPPAATPGALIQLFKSKEYNKAKSQFLVFITPQIHETSSTANKEIQEKFNLKEVKQ